MYKNIAHCYLVQPPCHITDLLTYFPQPTWSLASLIQNLGFPPNCFGNYPHSLYFCDRTVIHLLIVFFQIKNVSWWNLALKNTFIPPSLRLRKCHRRGAGRMQDREKGSQMSSFGHDTTIIVSSPSLGLHKIDPVTVSHGEGRGYWDLTTVCWTISSW